MTKHPKTGFLANHLRALQDEANKNQQFIVDTENLPAATIMERFQRQVKLQEAAQWVIVIINHLDPPQQKIITPERPPNGLHVIN